MSSSDAIVNGVCLHSKRPDQSDTYRLKGDGIPAEQVTQRGETRVARPVRRPTVCGIALPPSSKVSPL